MRTLRQLLILLMILGAIFLYFNWDRVQTEILSLRDYRTSHAPEYPAEPAPPTESRQPTPITLYFIEITDVDLLLRPETHFVEAPLTMQKAIEGLIAGPMNSNLYPTMPGGTRLLQASLDNDLAVLSFSQELRTNFNSGSQGEHLLVQSLMRTLAAFSNVRRVQILVEGQIVESIGGHIAVNRPLHVRDY